MKGRAVGGGRGQSWEDSVSEASSASMADTETAKRGIPQE